MEPTKNKQLTVAAALAALILVAVGFSASISRYLGLHPDQGAIQHDIRTLSGTVVKNEFRARDEVPSPEPLGGPTLGNSPSASITVSVIWRETGQPITNLGLTVRRVERDVSPRSARTDHYGRFVLPGLRPGTYTVYLDTGQKQVIRLQAGERGNASFELDEASRVVGRVIDENDRPVHRALIYGGTRNALHGDRALAVADPDGVFEIAGLSDSAMIWALHPQKGASAAVSPFEESESLVLTLSVGASGAINGYVRGSSGEVGSFARIICGASRNSEPSLLDTSRPTIQVVDEKGEFSICGLRPGTYLLQCQAPNHQTSFLSVTVEGGEAKTVCVELLQGYSIRGRILDVTGSGAEASIAISRPPSGLMIARAETLEDGFFEIGGLSPGAHQLHARSSSGRARVDLYVASDLNNLSVRLDRFPAIRGRVCQEDGVPLPGWHVALRQAPLGALFLSEAFTDPDGKFLLDATRLQSGLSCVVEARTKGWIAGPAIIAEQLLGDAGAQEALLIVPEAAVPSATISGTLQVESGHAIRSATLVFSQAGGAHDLPRFPLQLVIRDGSFLVGPVAPMIGVRVQILSKWTLPRELGVFDVLQESNLNLGNVILDAAGRIEVQVSNPEATSELFACLRAVDEAAFGPSYALTNGYCEIGPVVPGGYAMKIAGVGVRPVELDVVVHPGQLADVRTAIVGVK